MKNSRVIALSALSCALAIVFLVIGSFIEVLDLSCLFMASLALMMPLAKDYKWGAFMAYLATVVLSFFFTMMRVQVIVPFAMFFGLHPLANYLQNKFKINNILAFVIKTVWFIGTLYVMYFATKIFTAPNALIEKYIHYVLIIGGALFFFIYDKMMEIFQKAVNNLVRRLKL